MVLCFWSIRLKTHSLLFTSETFFPWAWLLESKEMCLTLLVSSLKPWYSPCKEAEQFSDKSFGYTHFSPEIYKKINAFISFPFPSVLPYFIWNVGQIISAKLLIESFRYFSAYEPKKAFPYFKLMEHPLTLAISSFSSQS